MVPQRDLSQDPSGAETGSQPWNPDSLFHTEVSHTQLPYLPVCLSALELTCTEGITPPHPPKNKAAHYQLSPHPHPNEIANTGQQSCLGTEKEQGQGAREGTGCQRTPLALSVGEKQDPTQG